MNAKTDRWEIYTDRAGRRHWRWPATSAPSERDGRDVDVDSRQRAGMPVPQQAYFFAPLLARGK
jgi:hypothetical protein